MRALAQAAASPDAATAALAQHNLGSMHHGSSRDLRVPLDLDASAREYAACVHTLLGNPAVAAANAVVLADAVHACACAVVEDELPFESEGAQCALGALTAACSACDGGAPKVVNADVAVMAWFGRAQAATQRRADREKAARCYRRAVAAGTRLAVNCDARARHNAAVAARNLAVLEARTSEELAAADAAVVADAENLSQLYVTSSAGGAAVPVDRGRCASCGAAPLVLKRCGGTCGGRVKYCGAACYAAHVREHMQRDGCRKVKA